MKKSHIKNIILFLALIVGIDFGLGKIISNNFYTLNYGDYSIINKSLKSDTEVLVLGSSRALHHYNPNIISKSLNLSCYNAGFGGYGVFLNYAILYEKIKVNSPKIVIIDLSPNIIVDKNAYSKLNLLLPYYKKNSSFKEIIQLNPKFSKLELVSNLYIYNSTLYDFTRSYFTENNDNNLGFFPLKGKINKGDYSPFFLEKENMDENNIDYMNKIINLCKQNNIRLVGVVSPTYEKFDKENKIISSLASIFKNNSFEFYNYSNYSKFYQKPEYFKDQLHLNEFGATIFSTNMAEVIKNK